MQMVLISIAEVLENMILDVRPIMMSSFPDSMTACECGDQTEKVHSCIGYCYIKQWPNWYRAYISYGIVVCNYIYSLQV